MSDRLLLQNMTPIHPNTETKFVYLLFSNCQNLFEKYNIN